jgi:hypothetical protein
MGLFTTGIDLGNSEEEKQKSDNTPFFTKLKNMVTPVSLERGPNNPDPNDVATYDSAVENHDSGALVNLAKKDPISEVGQTALSSAKTIENGKYELATLVAPIAKAPPNSPEANIAAANTFQTVKDNPKYGTALVRWLMGDKIGAGRLLTGGDETDNVVWDANGNSYTQTTNALGQRVGIVDAQNRPISREEADARKIGYSAYENTIAAKNRALNAENNVKQYAKDTQAENIFTAGAASDALKGRFIRDSLNSLPKEFINSDWYANTMGGVAQQLSRNQRQSSDLQNLDSYDKSVSSGQSTTVDKGMTSRAGWPGVFTLGADGKLVNENGEKHNLSELKQIIKGSHSSQEQGDTFNKTLESIMTSKQLAGLTPDQQSALRQSLVYSKEIADSQAERLASVKELGGRPAFTVLPSASNILDRRAQVNAQTYQLDYNDETMRAFNQFKKDVMPQYEKTGSYPLPRELEAKFVDTPTYKAIQDKYAKLIKVAHDSLASVEVQAGPATTEKKAVPVRPPIRALLKAAGG